MSDYTTDLDRFASLPSVRTLQQEGPPDPGRIPKWPWGTNPPPEVWERTKREVLSRTPPRCMVRLCDLLATVPRIRGVYETSAPNVSAPLCFQYGDECCRWIDRHPIWHRAAKPRLTTVRLYEVIPIEHPEGGYWIVSWDLEVIGEQEDRAAAALARSLRGPWGADVGV